MGLDMWLMYRQSLEEGDEKKDVMYWRKANHIHKWFLHNCAPEGYDPNTQEAIIVKAADLEALVNSCKDALELYDSGDVDGALKEMPTQQGFFFGATDPVVGDYEWYKDDLKDTIEKVSEILGWYTEEDEGQMTYEVWW